MASNKVANLLAKEDTIHPGSPAVTNQIDIYYPSPYYLQTTNIASSTSSPLPIRDLNKYTHSTHLKQRINNIVPNHDNLNNGFPMTF